MISTSARNIVLFFSNIVVISYLLGNSMAWRSHGKSNLDLVQNLRRNNIIRSDVVERVMAQVDRANYVSHNPYMDVPQGIGYGVTISAPHMHAHALELLREKLVDGAKALDVGSGSGYLTACMALMVGPSGLAVGIDHIKELVDSSRSNIKADHPELIESNRLKLIVGDGRLGSPEDAPFDAIHVGAASPDLPKDDIRCSFNEMDSPYARGAKLYWTARARMADEADLPNGKRPRGKPNRRWEDCIKADLKGLGLDSKRWREGPGVKYADIRCGVPQHHSCKSH
ncbi:unnamed protein product [Nezara viridula]|uniref:protein-L-isoaspartate(D-aspartate) O-methyltransferase n=1 Tax=Nezara viridula TaxID=85310 RepID=A0A9P0HMJ4_NEZVI|nr:unnamed protein product [Nezara viridula]